MPPRKTRSQNSTTRPSASDCPIKPRCTSAQVKADAEKKQQEKNNAKEARKKAIKDVAEVEERMVAQDTATKLTRKLQLPLFGPMGVLEKTYSIQDLNNPEEVSQWMKRTIAQRLDDAQTLGVDPKEFGLEEESDASTVPLDETESNDSELSDLEPTPKPAKKKRREASPDIPLRASINAEKGSPAPRALQMNGSRSMLNAVPIHEQKPGPTGIDRMDIDSDTHLVNNWAKPSHAASHVTVARTLTVPPSPFGSGTSKEVKHRPKNSVATSELMASVNGNATPGPTSMGDPAFTSDIEEDERKAAWASPMKGFWARLTNKNAVEVHDVDLATPQTKKLGKIKVNIQPGTPAGVIELQSSPLKSQRSSKKRSKKSKGKGKQKAKDADSSDSETEKGTERESQKTPVKKSGHGRMIGDPVMPSSGSGTMLVDQPESGGQFLSVPSKQNPASTASNGGYTSAASNTATGKVQYRLKDLPGGKWVQDRWATQFSPTLVRYVGARARPWSLDDTPTNTRTLQLIWDAVFGLDHPHEVAIGDVVHALASRRLTDWRKDIGKVGWRVVESFFASAPKYSMLEERVSLSKAMRVDDAFLFLNTLQQDQVGMFKSPFVSQVLAKHLDDINGAVDVPGLVADPKTLQWPCGGIALASAAVERIFKLYEEGHIALDEKGQPYRIPMKNPNTQRETHSHTNFSESNMCKSTDDFVALANAILDDRKALILDAACVYLAGGGKKAEGATQQRALLVVEKVSTRVRSHTHQLDSP
ncbi:hypothetical protein C8Q78DRAFT_1081519 [Trametes maxima]|nr:hypothetical protein C8Q78DRAFT_1081519 [Trametes maxima]